MLTYLFGAGASAETLPVIDGMKSRLSEFSDFIRELKFSIHQKFTSPFYKDITKTLNLVQDDLGKDLRDLIKEIDSHASIDTLAKKYYLTGQINQLRKLKAIIDIFLIFEQIRKGTDKRYDLFLSTILEGGPKKEIKLPKDINILTWNYDFQIEMSANNFFKNKFLPEIQENLNSIPRTNFTHINSRTGFSVAKLNGACGTYHDHNGNLQTFDAIPMVNYNFLTVGEKSVLIEALLGNYYYFTSPAMYSSSYISYAWEDDDIYKAIINKAHEIAKKTEYLVVIGYSFPTFNRKVDKLLLSKMPLKKVFIQSMPDTLDGVVKRAKALLQENTTITIEPIEMKTGKEEFYIPFEYA
jgi:hypothetical protein